MNLFSGLSAFPITPMTPSGEIIAADLSRLARRIEAGGAHSIVCSAAQGPMYSWVASSGGAPWRPPLGLSCRSR